MAAPDFYQILGVSPSASAEEIKSVHRELVKKYHPDLFLKSAEKARANKKLQQINDAYTTLSNEERRRQYNARLAQKARTVKPAATATKSRSTATPHRPPAITTRENIAKWVNEKLQQARKAYQNLSDAGRRLAQEIRAARRAAATSQKTSTSSASRPSAMAWKNAAKRLADCFSAKATGGILGIMILALILKALWKETEPAIAWTLLESMVVEQSPDSAGQKSGERTWTRLGYHSSQSECADSLKQRVAMDERRGSKAFLDEHNATIAMTIYVRNEATLTEEYLQAKLKQTTPDTVDQQLLEQQAREEAQEFVRKNGIIQRVNNYQCREVQVAERDSWIRSKLKQLGLIS